MINNHLFLLEKREKAFILRKKLLELGYKQLVYCDTNDVGAFSFHYYSLSKEDVIGNDSSCSCLPVLLESEAALSYFEAAMDQTIISPDLTSIDINSEINQNLIIEQDRHNKEISIRFQKEKAYSQRAIELQKTLLDQGYKVLEFCDEIDDGIVMSSHFNLSKDDEIAKPDSCVLYKRIDLESEDAFQILLSWVKQTVINPNPKII